MSDDKVVSLGSARALKTGDCTQWTVRDALADVIRAIDAKEMNPERVIICTTQEFEDGSDTSVICAGVNHLEAVGLAHNMINVLTSEDY